ncbi:hypothetical protein DF186_19420, partial [Enterococcus hirae]
GWGAREYVQGVAAHADENARSYANAAYRSAKLAHAADYWQDKVEQQERYLAYLRASGAPAHEVVQAEKDLDYYKQEMWQAQRSIT